MFAPSYRGPGPRCGCGCPYLRGVVRVSLVLAASGVTVRLVGPTVRDLPVESLTCEACGTETVTRDLPPVGIDVAAVLEELASGATRSGPQRVPACVCGADALVFSTVLALVVHAAGTTMVGEVPTAPVRTAAGTLSCAGCSRSWDAADADLPSQVRLAHDAFGAALSKGEIEWSD